MSYWDDVQVVYAPYPGAIITTWWPVEMSQPEAREPVEVEGADLIRWAGDGGFVSE